MKMQCLAVADDDSAFKPLGNDRPSNPSELSRNNSRRLTRRFARCAETSEIMESPLAIGCLWIRVATALSLLLSSDFRFACNRLLFDEAIS